MTKIIAFDVETSMNAPESVGKAHPRHPSNSIVLAATYDGTSTAYNLNAVLSATSNDIIVGHNIGFDLKYFYGRSPYAPKELGEFQIWDTQLAAYLLSAQQDKFISLDELSQRYGLPCKDSTVTDYFKSGKGADHVPIAILKDYLENDVRNTWEIAQHQMQEAVEKNMMPLIVSQMEALFATTIMTYSGLTVDTKVLNDYTRAMIIEEAKLKEEANKLIDQLNVGLKYPYHPDISSNKQLSMFFFGGEVKEDSVVPVGMYKNGRVKTKKVTIKRKIEGVYRGTIYSSWKTESGKGWSVDDEVLSEMHLTAVDKTLKEFLDAVLSFRKVTKILHTYCEGFSELIIEGHIYGNLNHTNTATGRLASSKPNLQNIPPGIFKSIFVSEYGSAGSLLEFDFSQLEVVVLAHLSGDSQLRDDINNDRDIHSELYKDMYGNYPTKEARKAFKPLTFGLLYGAGAKTLAKNAKVSIYDAHKFITTFYTRYPGVGEWHKKQEELVEKESVAIPKGLGERAAVLVSETGRRYYYKEYPAADWAVTKTGRVYNFSPTEIKNYPVQGLATGDIVPLMLGVLFREVITSGKYNSAIIKNTIHDSILFDVRDEEVEELVHHVVAILRDTPSYYKHRFGKEFSCKLDCGCNIGKDWYNMVEVDV